MMLKTAGIHHITAFAGNPQQNVDFYAGVLGLRLVKKTVNFDAPDVYHLYFGNEVGSPGTAMTFFPFDGARRGKIGGGQVGFTTFVVPMGALGFWEERLKRFNIPYRQTTRFRETYLQFKDWEGMQLEIVEREEGPLSKWAFDGIPSDKAIKGFGGAILYSTAPDKTRKALEVMGLAEAEEEGGFVRFRSYGDLGNVIDLNAIPMEHGIGGAGTVHHIAWRSKTEEENIAWRQQVLAAGFSPTGILDRNYFKSVYFREQGGILFEIASDTPGFLIDESYDSLGEKLMLPSWLEPHRKVLESNLVPITVREVEGERK